MSESKNKSEHLTNIQELQELGVKGYLSYAADQLSKGGGDYSDLRIVLDSLQPGPMDRVARITDKIGLFEGIRSVSRTSDIKRSLDNSIRSWVKRNHGLHFNPHSPDAWLIAEADLLQAEGIFEDLKLSWEEDPLRDERINHFTQAFNAAAKRGTAMDLPPSTKDCYLGLASFVTDLNDYRANKLRPSRQPSLWQIIKERPSYAIAKDHVIELNNRLGLIGQSDADYDLLYSRPQFIAEIMDGAAANNNLELFGVCWAAALGTNQLKLANYYRPFAEEVLEDYVVKGRPLIERGVAPLWLLQVAIDQLRPDKPECSLFTDRGFPAKEDRRMTAASLSAGLHARYEAGFERHSPEFWIGAEAWLHTAVPPNRDYPERVNATQNRLASLKANKIVKPRAWGQALRLPRQIVKLYQTVS